ncbi:MAG: ATP synthase F1 subunit epsilon [Atopobium sp.]|uniref:ATP synthase F1 subunit epsilon n=1 Tax=Atopobium sp. TaxID=1872650 RepID=UPI002A74DFBB|nr:ATP synthase F1 subunit epsilon [Atopobium sp.]MDY2788444.1 ATP synthase F1 subunit epsilon [Atopobium sp.]MDY4522827.1 ATP synthase F1 subunit epsilon [Atopobium sp.]
MAYLTCKFVRPDKQLYEGNIASLVLATYTGELGVWPGHAAEICALGDGIVRLTTLPEDGGDIKKVIVSGGYAEIADDTVVIIADHARDINDIDVTQVNETRQKALDARNALPENDHRRAYYENKIHWCDLLLQHGQTEA